MISHVGTSRLAVRCSMMVAAMCLVRAPARADISTAVYDDAKGIIIELLTDEIAQAIVPSLVCYAGHDALPDRPAPRSSTETDPPDPPSVLMINGKRYRLQALYYYPQTLQHVYTRQFGSMRTTAIHESAELAGFQLYTLLQGLSSSTLTRFGGGDTTGSNTQYRWPTGELHSACASAVRTAFAAGSFAVAVAGPLESECKSPDSLAKQFNCDLGLALSSALSGDGAAADDDLIKAISVVLVEAITDRFPVPPDRQARLYERTAVFMRDIISKDARLDKLIPEYVADVIAIIGPQREADIRAAMKKLETAIDRIRLQWRLATSNGVTGVNLVAFFQTMATSAGSLADLCDSRPSPVCRSFQKLQGAVEKGEFLWPIVRAAAQRNLSEAANVAIRAIFGTHEAKSCSTESEPGADCQGNAFRDFLIAFVQYLVEATTEGTPTEVTRAALRTAAVQAIRSVGVAGGFDRRGWLRWHHIPYLPGTGFFYPEFGLRASWNSAYLNTKDSSLRYIATANMFTFKPLIRFTDSTYAAVHISFFDPLSPLSELAIRKTAGVTYQDEGKLWWNFITPRVEMVYGIPELSKHLVIGAGFSARLVVPLKDDPAVETYRYRGIGLSWSAELAKHVEYGFVLKYVL
jgi:hypothetical protein